MLSITPVRERISERFPVASFVVSVPPDRYFEVAYATDPRLFRAENKHLRRSTNFATSRTDGLLRAPAGQATYMIPPHQLKRFAGQQRLYYAVASFRGARNEEPVLTLAADRLERTPSIMISPDFTGRSLDRGKIGVADARYGGDAGAIGWGGDDVLVARAAAPQRLGASAETAEPFEYNDGFDPSLWAQVKEKEEEEEREDGDTYGRRGVDSRGEPFGYEDAAELLLCGVEPAGYEDAVALPIEAAAGLSDDELGYEDAPDLERVLGSRGGSAVAPLIPILPPAQAAPLMSSPRYGGGTAATHHERYGSAGGAVLRAPSYGGGEVEGYEDVPDLVRNLGPRHRHAYGNGAAAMPAPVPPPPASARFPDYSDDISAAETLPEVAQVMAADDTFTAADPRHRLRILDRVAAAESGTERYRAVSADATAGLLWGYVQFPQKFGGLGHVLRVCHRRDRASYIRCFGEHNAAPPGDDIDLGALPATNLLRVTNALAAEARMAPVAPPGDGQPGVLWQAPWLDVFRAAGEVPAFQEAQREVADRRLYLPYIDLLHWLGIDSVRGHAMFVDRAIQMGGGGAVRWIARLAGAIRSQADLRRALDHLGHADLRAFQASPPHGVTIPAVDGVFGPLSHAALTQALRLRGDSPLPLRAEAEILASLCSEAERQADASPSWRTAAQRLKALKDDASLDRLPGEAAR